MKKLGILIFGYSLLAFSTSADEIKLLNAPIEAVTAYFSSLTGKTYILEFNTSARTTISTDVETVRETEKLFSEIITNLGGALTEIDENTIRITSDLDTSINEMAVSPDVTEIRRIYLNKRIEFRVLTEVVNQHPSWSAIKLVGESEQRDSILAIGEPAVIESLTEWIESLNVLKEAPKPDVTSSERKLDDEDIQVVKEPEKDNKFVAIDLNYADANEVVGSVSKIIVASGLENSFGISAHESGNQILLNGDLKAILQTKSIIKTLDRPPRQVYVDAIIAEISEVTAKKLGLQFSAQNSNVGISNVTGVSTPNIGNFSGNAFLAGAAGGVLAIGGGASKIPDLGVLLTAIQGDTDNRILSTPSIMAAENKESTILIGQNVPFITGQFTTESDAGQTPFQTIQREDLGTKLKLKPRIGLENSITMQISQEVSRIDQTATGLSDVATVKREIETVVTAEPGETVAIGGLRVEQEEIAISKIPILGDLPIIGKGFRQETKNTVSRNLVIFLRPTLVTSELERKNLTEIWIDEVGDELVDYEKSKSSFFEPVPVGKRLKLNELRPKLRPKK